MTAGVDPTPRSLWLEQALATEPEADAPLREDIRCDVCIVGGGYTGLWSAIRLKEAQPSLEVVLLERDRCGSGASGRNGGFLGSWWSKFLSLEKICGSAEALRLARASAAAIDDILAFCERHGIDVEARRDGWLWTATNDAQLGAWEDTMAALAAHGEAPLLAWPAGEVAARSGSAQHLGGVFEAAAATLQPARLARGLARVARELGVRIFENSALTDLTHGAPATVHTALGRVQADRVIVAMNAWAARWAEIRKAIVVVSGDIIATAPIGEQLERIGWRDGLGISDGRALVHYYRTTLDGRVVFGKGGMSGDFCFGGRIGDAVEGASSIAGQVAAGFYRTYPMLRDVEIEHNWRGPIDRSDAGLPIFSHLGRLRNVWFGVGFSGNGVGPCYIAGRVLAAQALGVQDEWSQCGLVRSPQRDFPPEPLRFIGSHLLRRALVAADDAADAGQPAPLSARLLAGFAPAGVSPFKVKD